MASVIQILPDIDPTVRLLVYILIQFVLERFEQLPVPHMASAIPLLLSQILDQPYPRVNRKRTATAADLDKEDTGLLDYSDAKRPRANPQTTRIAYVLRFSDSGCKS